MALIRTLRALWLEALSTSTAAPPRIHTSASQLNSNRTSIACIGRQKYARLYPVLLVKPDGSTIHIRYKEPKRILAIPIDSNTLPEAERRARLLKRKAALLQSKQEAVYEDVFNLDDYKKFWKK
uniref:Large ribosomal subunit protein mL55 n=1 Tax=Pogona vitticeps TaxID=103695 RepID=A0A6J0UMX0_9SAUR